MSDRRENPVERRAIAPDQIPAPDPNVALILYRMEQVEKKVDKVLDQTTRTNGRVTASEMRNAGIDGEDRNSALTADWQLKLIGILVAVSTLATGVIALVTQ